MKNETYIELLNIHHISTGSKLTPRQMALAQQQQLTAVPPSNHLTALGANSSVQPYQYAFPNVVKVQ